MNDGAFTILKESFALTLTRANKFSAVAAFSLRRGGQSPPPLDSLNFSTKHGDSPENVRINFQLFAQHLAIKADQIVTCEQVHGDTIAVINSLPAFPGQADALVAVGPGIFPAVKTADCVPILLLDPAHRVSAAIHAGWRGTALRITRKVVDLMQREFETDVSDLVATLGPAIGSCCYEVDDQVVMAIRHNVPRGEKFVTPGKPNHRGNQRARSYQLDLGGINRFELTSMGIMAKNIYSTNHCTSCDPNLFFSHRRDGVASGRHIAVAGFKA
jgi:polyphenol oxidase